MSFWGTLLGTLFLVLREVLPLVVEWLRSRHVTPLQQARERALNLQDEAARRARLILEQDEDELSKRDTLVLNSLDILFRKRELRQKGDTATD